jgi:Ca-activated chloride channel family protein
MPQMLVRLAEPSFLLLLLAVVPVAWWYVRTARREQPRLGFPTTRVAGRLRRTARQALGPLPFGLRMAALALVALALAHPTVSRAADDTPGNGIDIAIAVDVSYSMSANDLGPKSRLETTKDVIRQFVAGRSGDRIGLVAFGSEAITVSPLTVDYPMLLKLVDELGHGRLPEGTAIGNGLATAVNLLRDGTGKSRVVILLTDGQNNAGEIQPEAAAQMAKVMNIRAYTIGAGAAPPNRPSTRPGQAAQGVNIDEELLRKMSETTGAAYFRAVDESALRQVYEMIGRLEKTDTGQQKWVEVMDLTGYALGAALALLLIETLLRTTWLRRVP